MIFRKCIAIVIDFIKKFFLFPVGIFLFMLDVIKFCTQFFFENFTIIGQLSYPGFCFTMGSLLIKLSLIGNNFR